MYTHTHIYSEHVFKSGALRGDKGGGKEEKNDRELILLKYITSV
jgi:hypothetical protein